MATRYPVNTIRQVKLNVSVEQVSWPASLQEVTFGLSSYRPLSSVVWPSSVRSLNLEYSFSHLVDTVQLRDRLQNLTLGGQFNEPVETLTWPTSLSTPSPSGPGSTGRLRIRTGLRRSKALRSAFTSTTHSMACRGHVLRQISFGHFIRSFLQQPY